MTDAPDTVRWPAIPETITRAQALTALDALGLPHDVVHLVLDCRDGVTVAVTARDAPTGHVIRLGDGPGEFTAHIPFREEVAGDAPA